MSEDRSFWSLFEEPKEEASSGSNAWRLFDSSADELQTADGDEPRNCALAFDEDYVFWAMRDLPIRHALTHFLVTGASGSGKTTAIKLFLQSVAPRFKPGWSRKRKEGENEEARDGQQPEQLILFDAKCDTVSLLAKLGLTLENRNLYILNPYDTRSAVWNVAEAVRTPVMARSLATLLVPEEKNSTAPFFSNAARELVYDVLLALNQIPGDVWTLRDLLCALESREHIAAVTAHDPRASALAARVLGDGQHSDGVLSTLATKLGPLEQVAALWSTNTSGIEFTIEQFLKEPGVLVLGNDPVLRDSFWPLNAILLKALTHEILRGPDTRLPRCWFVLDEFRAMENVDCIHELLNRGRSKGASVVLGIQSVEGIEEVYGENAANDILSQCANKMFLRAGGPKTAEWAESFFSKVRRIEDTVTDTTLDHSKSKSIQHSLQERSLFLASYFLDLPMPGPGEPFVAVCDVPSLRETLIVRRHFDELLTWCRKLSPEDGANETQLKVPDVVPRTNLDEQRLWPWTVDEELRFCGPPPREKGKPISNTGGPAIRASQKRVPLDQVMRHDQ